MLKEEEGGGDLGGDNRSKFKIKVGWQLLY